MKRPKPSSLILAAALSALLFAQSVVAQAKRADDIAVGGLAYDVTDVRLESRSNGRLVVAAAATATGVIDCLGNPTCEGRGLDGQTVSTRQSFRVVIDTDKRRVGGRIVIDVIGAGIVIDVIHAGFKGTVRGSSQPSGPDALGLDLRVEARARGGAILGIDLSAVVNKVTGSIVIDVIHAGVVLPRA